MRTFPSELFSGDGDHCVCIDSSNAIAVMCDSSGQCKETMDVITVNDITPEERVKYSRLFAAAPELLARLKLALKYLEHPDVQKMPFALSASAVALQIRKTLEKAQA
jgi:hypothetical protein